MRKKLRRGAQSVIISAADSAYTKLYASAPSQPFAITPALHTLKNYR